MSVRLHVRTLGLAAIAIGALATAGCSKRKEEQAFPEVVRVTENDVEMAAAMGKAQATLDEFIATLQARASPTLHDFAVKAVFRDGDHVEHMWINPVEYDGKRFTGRLNDDPVEITTLKRNDLVFAGRPGISDWMYIDGHKLRGGYTLRVMRSRLPEKERKELDQSLGYEFE